MPEKQMVSAKIADRTKERLDDYADREGISRSQAIGMILKQGLDVEESDMRLVPVQSDGGTKIEKKIESVETQINEQNQELEKQERWQNIQTFGIIVSVLWLAVVYSFDLSPVWTSATGIGLIVVLLTATQKIRSSNND